MTKRLISLVMASALLIPLEALGIGYTPLAPERPQLDANGVDVQSLTLQRTFKFLSIGPQGMGGLEYTIYGGGRDSFTSGYHYVYPHGDPTFVEYGIANYGNSFLDNWPKNPDGSTSSIGGGGSPPVLGFKDGKVVEYGYGIAGNQDEEWSIASAIQYPNGVRVTFHYRNVVYQGLSRDRIQSVTTNTGYQMKFNYALNAQPTNFAELNIWGVPTSIVAVNNAVQYCDPDADTCSLSGWPTLQISYTNITDGLITTYTDPLNNQTLFKATGSGTYPNRTGTFQTQTADSSSYNIVYTWAETWDPCTGGLPPPYCGGEYVNKITSATINGRTTNYAFSYITNTSTTVDTYAPLSQHYTYKADMGLHGIRSVTDPLIRVTEFAYSSDRRLTTTTAPEDNSWVNTISDSNPPPNAHTRNNIIQITANAKPGSGQSPIAEYWSFPSCVSLSIKVCNQPESYTDPRGNTTSYTYSSDHGGVLTETLPAVGGINPVKRYAYEQRYAWIKNSGGTYSQAPTPVSVRTEERTCISTATVGNACAGGSSDEVVISYDYGSNSGPNNLNMRGKVVTASGVSLRSCYAYDRYGNKMSETTPRAGLTSCP